MLYIDRDGRYFDADLTDDYTQSVIDLLKKWDSGASTFDIHTSGSTGNPKQISLTRAQIIASIETTKSAFDLQEGDCVFCCLHVSYIAGMMMVFRARHLRLGLYVVPPSAQPIDALVCEKLGMSSLAKKLFFAFVPMQLQQILRVESARNLLGQGKAILIGGAPISAHLKEMIQSFTFPIWATYGMTETVSHVAIQPYSPEYVPYFTVLDGVQIRQNKEHCLEIHSRMSGDEWLVTNDLVEMVSHNSFRVIGRADQVINSGGVKIPLGKIDDELGKWLASKGEHQRFFAWGTPDEILGQRLVVFFEGTGTMGTIDDFWTFASKRLKAFEKPKEWLFVPEFQETPTAKIDKIKTVEYARN